MRGRGPAINKVLGCFIIYQCILFGLWIVIELNQNWSGILVMILFFMAQCLGIFFLLYKVRRALLDYTDKISSRIDRLVASLKSGDSMEGKGDSIVQLEESLFQKVDQRLVRLEECLYKEHHALLREKNDLQGLISDISHQIKTPMANVKIIHGTLLEQRLDPEKQKEFLIAMDTQLDKIEFLMQGMIKTSRLEAGVIELRKERAPIYDGIASALGSIILEAQKKEIDIRISCDASLMVAYDRKWTGEALFNILDNGVKYTPPGGHMTIVVEALEMYLRIDIADDGPGIEEEEMAHIFERFYRGEHVHSIEGIGIGLYLTRKIIVGQGGYIKVARPLGGGTCFSIFLPKK